MKMKIGKSYIVEVSEEGIVPVEEFDKDRFFNKDHDDLDFLTEAEKEDVAITTLNKLYDKVWDMSTEYTPTDTEYDEAISGVLDLIDQFKRDIRSEGSDKCSQEKRTGYWIVEAGDRETGYGGCTVCSECLGEGDTEMDYCPHCGAKMESDSNADKSRSDEYISRAEAKQTIEKICETYKISYGDSYGGFGKALYHAFDKPNSTENLSDANADECPCDKCRHDGGDIECSGCGDDHSHFEPKKSAKCYVTYDSKGEVIGVSDHLQIDKCENYGGYIMNADTHEVCYQSAAHYCKHGNCRINKEKPSDVEKAITFAETWLDMHEDATENPHSHWFYRTVLGILKKIEKLASGTNIDVIKALFGEMKVVEGDYVDASRRLKVNYDWGNRPYKLPNSNKDKEVGV